MKRIFALLLCLMLLPVAALAEEAESDVQIITITCTGDTTLGSSKRVQTKFADASYQAYIEKYGYAYPFEGSDDEKKIPDVDNVPDGMKLVTGNDVAYRFFAPNDWQVGNAEAAALVYASEEDRSNVTVMGYVPETEGYSVADYWENTEKYYKDTLRDYTPTAEPAEETLGGRKATVYEYTYTVGGVTYQCRQAVCVYSYMIVVMTYTALPENYDAHLADVQAMQEALTFRKPIVG